MLFGRRADSVAPPVPNPPTDTPDTVATAKLELVAPDHRQLQRAVAQVADDVKWLGERFEKLQNRVTSELREIRREVDRFYDEPEEE